MQRLDKMTDDSKVIDNETGEIIPAPERKRPGPKAKRTGPTQIDLLEAKLAQLKKSQERHVHMKDYHSNVNPNSIATRPFAATQDQKDLVYQLSSVGVAQEHIANSIKDLDGEPISIATLKKYFLDELTRGVVDSSSKVGAAVLRKATAANLDMAGVKAAELYLTRKGGWLENNKTTVEVTGKDGGPIEVNKTVDIGREAAELLRELADAKAALAGSEIIVVKNSQT